MSLTRWIIFALLGLPVAELLVFGLVAAWLGFLSAVLLALATSFLGFLVLRHAGTSGIGQFRVAMADGSVAGQVQRGGRMHLVASGILLFIPGFITDLVGVLILLPPVRRSLAATFGRALRRHVPGAGGASDRPSVIDLEPDEWHQVDGGGSAKRPRKPRIR
jgi:UPF0716 protein FxsA